MKLPHLLIVSAGAAREYREYILKSISQYYRITLLDNRVQQWTDSYIYSQVPLDIFNDQAFSTIEGIHDKDPFDGVLCYDESRITLAAKLAELLGLPSGNSKAIAACRDKHLTRLALADAGIPQPQSVVVDSLETAIQTSESIGFPVILKPRALMASEGVVVVKNLTELKNAYYETAKLTLDVGDNSQFNSLLIEEYVDGPEFSVDGAVVEGKYTPLFIAEKSTGFPPFFEEVAHTVNALDPRITDKNFMDLLQNIHTALGLNTTMTHIEFRLTNKGISIIEVNARLGGDLIPRVGWYATGIDAALIAASIAVGLTPDFSRSSEGTAKIQFYYPPTKTLVNSVRWISNKGIVEAGTLVESGDLVDIPPAQFVIGRVAYAIALNDEVQGLNTALEEFGKNLLISSKV